MDFNFLSSYYSQIIIIKFFIVVSTQWDVGEKETRNKFCKDKLLQKIREKKIKEATSLIDYNDNCSFIHQ